MDKAMDDIFNNCIKEDNQLCTALSKSIIVNDRLKHIDILYHLLINNIEKETVSVKYIPTSDMIADALTKAPPQNKF